MGNIINSFRFDSQNPNLIVNGTFDTDTDWSKTGWTIGSGVATSPDASSVQIRQNQSFAADTYEITIEVTSYTSGGELVVRINDTSLETVVGSNAVGTYTMDYVAGSGSGWFDILSNINDFIGSIDNVEVRVK